jgi:hypothetical protein
MLFNLMDHLKQKDDLKNVHRGIVVKNNDPKKLGRVKVTVEGILEDITNDYEKLPWCAPVESNTTPSSKGNTIKPPKIGSVLRIKFAGKPYFPFYDGYWKNKTNTLSHDDINGFTDLFKEDYPDVVGWAESLTEYEIFNRNKGSYERGFEGGVKYHVDKNGDYIFTGVANYTIKDATNVKIENSQKTVITSGGEINFTSTDGKVISTSKVGNVTLQETIQAPIGVVCGSIETPCLILGIAHVGSKTVHAST